MVRPEDCSKYTHIQRFVVLPHSKLTGIQTLESRVLATLRVLAAFIQAFRH